MKPVPQKAVQQFNGLAKVGRPRGGSSHGTALQKVVQTRGCNMGCQGCGYFHPDLVSMFDLSGFSGR
jgi:hypothetical protein|tara:strand:- start:1931 stop:2131 length:201 start_codon:yes stop_codon:yes gene_type:complete